MFRIRERRGLFNAGQTGLFHITLAYAHFTEVATVHEEVITLFTQTPFLYLQTGQANILVTTAVGNAVLVHKL